MLNPLLAHEVTREVHRDRLRRAEAQRRVAKVRRPKRLRGLARRSQASAEDRKSKPRRGPDPVLAA